MVLACLIRQLCKLAATAENKEETSRLTNGEEQLIYKSPYPEKQLITFAVGCGRSGTHFIARLMEHDSRIVSYHLDTIGDTIADSFLTYCEWNNIPVDKEGFFHKRKCLIDNAALSGKVYFEANPYLSFSVVSIFQRFRAKFIYMVRRPEDTVNSHYVKGWYEETPIKADVKLNLGFQYGMKKANHFFGRIVPHGQEFLRWKKLTRIGKIAWMWNTINLEIVRQLKELPKEHYIMVKLEELDYDYYLKVHSFVGGRSPLTEQEFEKIRKAKPGRGLKKLSHTTWSEQERQEVLSETKRARKILGYL